MSDISATTGVVLPAGVTSVGWRETSQANALGNITQGIVFTYMLDGSGNFSIFIPNAQLTNPSAINAAINAKVAAIRAISGAATEG